MIAPISDWTLSVVPRDAERERRRPASTAGIVRSTTSGSRSDWKFAASEQHDDDDREQQALAQARRASCASARPGRAPRPSRRAAARRRDAIARSTSSAAAPRSSPATFAVDADRALAVVVVDLAGRRSRRDRRDVARGAAAAAPSRITGRFEQVVGRLRSGSPARAPPRDRRRRSAGWSRRSAWSARSTRSRATIDLPTRSTVTPELAGALAIDVDVERRVVERLRDLHVAQRRACFASAPTIFSRERAASRRGSCPRRVTSIGVGAPKFEHLRDDVARLEREAHVGIRSRERRARSRSSSASMDARGRSRLERREEHAPPAAGVEHVDAR